MALLQSEVIRIRAELGYNVMGLQALPYIGITTIFDSVIQQYITSGATTSSLSPVTASRIPAPQTIQVANADGIHVGDCLVIDVDHRQESATVQHVSGLAVTLMLALQHGPGPYPVTVEGGETIVREKLRELKALQLGGIGGTAGAMSRLKTRLGLKKVDDVEFFGGNGLMSQGESPQKQLVAMIDILRDELASILGVPRRNKTGGGGGVEL
jgi:hypothetical protein